MNYFHRGQNQRKFLKNVVFSVTCSLLRQVCRKSRRNDCSPSLQTQIPVREFPFDPARASRGLSVLAACLGILAFAPAYAEGWKTGSTFVADKDQGGWTSNVFASETEGRQRENPYRSAVPRRFKLDPALSPLSNLRNLISTAEAGHMDYDAVVDSATIKPAALPTAMTVCQIRDWITSTPGQNHAIGRYQFIPTTLARLARLTGHESGPGCNARFSPGLQDRWANILIQEAGYLKFNNSELAPDQFMDALASVWAGLPMASGKSRYQGMAGNSATLSRNHYVLAMAQIFPAQIRISGTPSPPGDFAP